MAFLMRQTRDGFAFCHAARRLKIETKQLEIIAMKRFKISAFGRMKFTVF